MAVKAVERLQFQGVALHKSSRVDDPPINMTAFYTKLHESIETRFLDSKDEDIAQWSRVLDQKHWPGDLCDNLTFGEAEDFNFTKRNARKIAASAARLEHYSYFFERA